MTRIGRAGSESAMPRVLRRFSMPKPVKQEQTDDHLTTRPRLAAMARALPQTSIGLEELVAGLSERDLTGQCHLSLLWERIDLVISRFHSADVRARLGPQEVTVVRTDSDDVASLEISEETTRLLHAAPTHPATTLVDSSDAVLRLIYGRSRPHDDLKVVGMAARSDMAELFPGF